MDQKAAAAQEAVTRIVIFRAICIIHGSPGSGTIPAN